MVENLYTVFTNFKEEFSIDGIAISAPGSIEPGQRYISGNSAIPYIHEFPIFDELETLFGCPVTIENDARCVALAELWKGNAMDRSNAVVVVIGSGIGGAVIVNDRIQHGHNAFGGEFGCLILDGKKTFSELGTAVTMSKRYNQRTNQNKNGQEVFELAKSGDIIAMEEVETFYHYLSIGLWNLQFVSDPSVILLGGGVSQHPDLIVEIRNRVNQLKQDIGLNMVEINIEISKFQNHANMVGAVYAFHNKPEDYLITQNR